MSLKPRPLGGRYMSLTVMVLATLVAIGFYFIWQRLVYGIGSVANVNPGYPWGLWVAVDVIVGSAFGCGGYAMALMVYALNRGKYHPLMRPALLGGLFGYGLAGLAVMIDLGRYINAMNLFLPWYVNINSVMLETALCVSLYVVVLAVEFAPAVFEKFGLERLRAFLQKYMWIIAALGMLLPTMHQSSLGTVLAVGESRLSHLWWTQALPLLYLSSAIAMGYGVVAFEATLVSRNFKLESELPLLASLSGVAFWFVAVFMAIRIGVIVAAGNIGLAFEPGLEAAMFWIETFLFGAALVLLWRESRRLSERGVFLAACAVLLGGTLYRIDSYLVAYQGTIGWRYFPSVPELMITIGIVSLEVLLYILFVKFLPILSNPALPAEGHAS